VAREWLEDEIFRLKNVQDKKEIARWPSKNYVPDYQKANAFLEEELTNATETGDRLNLSALLTRNKLNEEHKPLLETIQQSLDDRFLDFQIAEMEKSLAELDTK